MAPRRLRLLNGHKPEVRACPHEDSPIAALVWVVVKACNKPEVHACPHEESPIAALVLVVAKACIDTVTNRCLLGLLLHTARL